MSTYREFLECFKKNYVEKTYTFASTCRACGYTEQTIYNWRRKNEQFREKLDALSKQRRQFDQSKLVEKAETGLHDLVTKVRRKIKEQYWESLKDENGIVVLDERGKPRMQLVSEKTVEKECQPSIMAITFILQNLDKDTYGKQEIVDMLSNINRSMTLEVVHTNKPDETDKPEGDAE